jgi:hypothetical protein
VRVRACVRACPCVLACVHCKWNLKFVCVRVCACELFCVHAYSACGTFIVCVCVCGRQGRNKKDARQVAAAAMLDQLLETVSPSEFTTVAKPKKVSSSMAASN